MAVIDDNGNGWISGPHGPVLLEDRFGNINPEGAKVLGERYVGEARAEKMALAPDQPILPIDAKVRRNRAENLERIGNQMVNASQFMKPIL